MPVTLAKLVTGTPSLLKDLSVEEVLEVHPLVNAQALSYKDAQKVKPIKARPINTILDKTLSSVFEDLLLATLEGQEALRRDGFICYGEAGDVWQQKKDALHKKYDPTEVDEDGWVTFVPKAEAICGAAEVTSEQNLGEFGGFSVINPWWGDERVISTDVLAQYGCNPSDWGLEPSDSGLVKLYLHYGVEGDIVIQNTGNKADTYRVAQSFFRNTYDYVS